MMSIEKGFIAECDDCDTSTVGYYDTIDEFVFKLKTDGWSTKKLDAFEGPLCYCKSCTDHKEPTDA